MINFLDHAFFIILAAVYPALSWFSYRNLRRRIAAGDVVNPIEIYRSTFTGLWTLFGMAAALWLFTERPWGALGLGWPGNTGFVIGLVLTIAALALVIRQFAGAGNVDGEARAAWLDQLGDLRVIVPRNDRELRYFYGMSATAGIVEETLWRGYLFWYLGHAMPLWAAAIVSSIIFGLGHAYQGMASMPKITLVGGVFAALYLLTGSVWLPMLLHAVFDAVQGRAMRRILDGDRGDPRMAVNPQAGEP